VESLSKCFTLETVPIHSVMWPDLAELMFQLAVFEPLWEYVFYLWHVLMRIEGGLFPPSGSPKSRVQDYIRAYEIKGLATKNLKHVLRLGSGSVWDIGKGRYATIRIFTPGQVFRTLKIQQSFSPRAMPRDALDGGLVRFKGYQFNGAISHIKFPVARKELQSRYHLDPKMQSAIQKAVTPPREDGHIIVGETNFTYQDIPKWQSQINRLMESGWRLREWEDIMVKNCAKTYLTSHLPRVEVQLDGRVVTVDDLDHHQSTEYFATEGDAETALRAWLDSNKRGPCPVDSPHNVFDGTWVRTRQGGREPKDGERPGMKAWLWEKKKDPTP